VHELALARSVCEIAARHSGGRPVRKVSLRVGALRQVVPSSLEFCFAQAARGSACEGARLEQRTEAALLSCEACGHRWDPAPPPARSAAELRPRFRCPGCGDAAVAVLRGEALEVESIEVVEEGEPCTARR
jgi:hydrogenase nickel incorporation protein HypA/HybF